LRESFKLIASRISQSPSSGAQARRVGSFGLRSIRKFEKRLVTELSSFWRRVFRDCLVEPVIGRAFRLRSLELARTKVGAIAGRRSRKGLKMKGFYKLIHCVDNSARARSGNGSRSCLIIRHDPVMQTALRQRLISQAKRALRLVLTSPRSFPQPLDSAA